MLYIRSRLWQNTRADHNVQDKKLKNRDVRLSTIHILMYPHVLCQYICSEDAQVDCECCIGRLTRILIKLIAREKGFLFNYPLLFFCVCFSAEIAECQQMCTLFSVQVIRQRGVFVEKFNKIVSPLFSSIFCVVIRLKVLLLPC